MTLGEKLATHRKQNNYTQEQLAELLGVSRQAVSKWESDLAYPETEKLIKLSELYDCSLDYLIKDKQPEEAQSDAQQFFARFNLNCLCFESKSKRMVHGVPLWHINIGPGRTAKGIFALGLAARGVFSCGLFSMGIFSCGLMSLGLLAFGSIALGLLALGAIAVGVIALGGVAVGVLALGGCAIGLVSAGGAAMAQYLAVGDDAKAQIAIGFTEARGEFFYVGEDIKMHYSNILHTIEMQVPSWLQWAADIVKAFI